MNATLICNPNAGKGGDAGRLQPAIEVLERAGWSLTVRYSDGAGDATRFAQEAVNAGVEAILVAGGDGTLNEAIQPVAGTDVALGYLPYGTVNVWARELNAPMDPVEAARALVEGRIEEIDLGIGGTRYFLLMAGIGFDSEVVRRARNVERYKARFGILPYMATGLSTVPLYRGADFELRYDGLIRRVQALNLIVGNTRLYGGRFHFTPEAVANDGWLDLCIVKGRGPLDLARQSLPLILLGSITRADVELVRVRELSVTTNAPIPVQMDGELAGETPMQFQVAPRSLRAIIPRDFASGLIA